MGSDLDYVCLPSDGASGGVVVAWCRSIWSVNRRVCRTFSVTVDLLPASGASPWSLAVVYGPVNDTRKLEFLGELRAIKADCPGPLLVCGDFNMIYLAADKNNDRLNRRDMRRFRRALDDMGVDELYLHGRLYTWSNERRRPTLERIDRAFASVDWLDAFPDHHLRALSSECSDHAPLLLQLRTQTWAKPRFRFEAFWTRLEGFSEVVSAAWLPPLDNIDASGCLTPSFVELRRR